MTRDDVVDAVLLDAHRQFVKHPPDEWLGGWLVRLAREHLDGEVKRFASERQRTPTHIEDDVPETPPAEAVSTLGDEILDFYEPDEDLKLEDVIPDLEMAGRVRFAKVNVDENPATASRFNVRSIPTLLVLKDGREVDRIVGVEPKSEIARRLAQFTG